MYNEINTMEEFNGKFNRNKIMSHDNDVGFIIKLMIFLFKRKKKQK